MKLFNDSRSRDYEGRCGNCHELFDDDGDLFCRYCGTRRGEGQFLPYENFMACVYGPPPVDRFHECKKCGFSWTTHRMVDRSAFCPKCGERL